MLHESRGGSLLVLLGLTCTPEGVAHESKFYMSDMEASRTCVTYLGLR